MRQFDLVGAQRGVRTTSSPAGVAELADAVIEAIAADVLAAWLGEPRVLPALAACVHANVTNILDVVERRLAIEDVNSAAALEFASLSAELDIPLSTVQRAYWVGVERFWNTWFESARATATDQSDLTERLSHVSQVLFAYVRLTLDRVAARYHAVSDDLPSRADGRRRALTTGLLDGTVEPTTEIEHRLGYRLGGVHVAMRVESADADAIRRTIHALARPIGARGALVVHLTGLSWVAWLGFDGDVAAVDMAALQRAVETTGLAAAIGEPAVGIDGFRATARQAEDTVAILGARGPLAVARYADVRLDVLLDQSARVDQFIGEELGRLGDDSDRSARIRETLLVWLSSGSQAQTAVQLGIHQNTVRLRIRAAGEVLHDAIDERRTELLVALRARALRDAQTAAHRAASDA